MDTQQWAPAEEALLTATRLDPASPLPHYALGLALTGQARHAEAAAAFGRCRDALRCIRESDPAARERFRGRLDREIQELRGAVAEIERERLQRAAISHQEVNGSAPPSLGRSTQAMHALEQRLSELQRLRENPEREPAAVGIALGNAWFHAGDLPAAEAGFRSALASEPDNGDAHQNLALVLMLEGQLDEAERHVRAAEKAGLRVPPRLKQELKQRRAASRP